MSDVWVNNEWQAQVFSLKSTKKYCMMLHLSCYIDLLLHDSSLAMTYNQKQSSYLIGRSIIDFHNFLTFVLLLLEEPTNLRIWHFIASGLYLLLKIAVGMFFQILYTKAFYFIFSHLTILWNGDCLPIINSDNKTHQHRAVKCCFCWFRIFRV